MRKQWQIRIGRHRYLVLGFFFTRGQEFVAFVRQREVPGRSQAMGLFQTLPTRYASSPPDDRTPFQESAEDLVVTAFSNLRKIRERYGNPWRAP